MYDNIGMLFCTRYFISEDIIPAKKDPVIVVPINIAVFTPSFFLINAPIMAPKEIPVVHPTKQSSKIKDSWLPKSTFKAKLKYPSKMRISEN